MHYPDLSLYDMFENVYNIGYLDKRQPFPKGTTELAFIEKLVAIYKREQTNKMRFIYICNLCNTTNDIINTPEFGLKFLGMAEIWVPDPDKDVIYVAPDLIIHYVHTHSYLPPQVFINAVMQFDLESPWSGEVELDKLWAARANKQ